MDKENDYLNKPKIKIRIHKITNSNNMRIFRWYEICVVSQEPGELNYNVQKLIVTKI